MGTLAADLKWDRLPDLPSGPDQEKQIGLAGAFTGVHNDALIVAGGANFSEGLPWEINSTGVVPPKIYHDDIFVLQQIEGGLEMDRFPDEASGVLGLWCIRIPSKVWPHLYWR